MMSKTEYKPDEFMEFFEHVVKQIRTRELLAMHRRIEQEINIRGTDKT